MFVVQSLGQIGQMSHFFFHILFCYKIFLEFLEEMFCSDQLMPFMSNNLVAFVIVQTLLN